jgi:uncharacterized protein YutE (UPF0331/DUF86 family)
MNARISDKIKEIERFVYELEEIIPVSFSVYCSDIKSKAACERYFERIVEAVVDLAFIVIKDVGAKVPSEDKDAFDLLVRLNVVPDVLSVRLKEAKGMRNIIAHEYGSIDDELVFDSIKVELVRDVKEFIGFVKKYGE